MAVKPVQFKDILSLKDSIETLGNIFNSFKEYTGFEGGEDFVFEMIASAKGNFNDAYKKFKDNFDKTMTFSGSSPNFSESDKDKENQYDFKRMQKDVKDIEKICSKLNGVASSYFKKQIDSQKLKREIENQNIQSLLDFIIEKYKDDNSNKNFEMSEKMQGSLFESDIKETKNDNKTKENNFDFEMNDEDVFGKAKEEENKISTFATDNEKNAFEGFDANKVKLILNIN